MITGGKMIATRITAEANGWGGVNIGQGTDVTAEPSFTFNSGTLQEHNPIQADNVGDKAPSTSWVIFGDNAGTWYATKSVRKEDNKTLIQWSSQLAGEAQTDGVTYPTLKEAIEAAKAGTIVTLLKDVTVDLGTEKNNPALLIDKAIDFNGNGKTITAKGDKEGIGHVLGVQSSNVEINALTIDGNNGTARHGIQTYGEGSAATLTEVTVKDCYGYGIVANGSAVTANGLYTSGNGWGGVNVTKGSGVTADPKFEFNYGDLQQDNPIQIDNVDKTVEVKAEWVAIHADMASDWHSVTTTDDGKTIIQFAPGAAIKSLSLNTSAMTLTEGNKGQLIATIEPETAADSVDALIGKIGTVAYTDDVYQAIKAAKEAYNGFEKQYEGQTSLVKQHATMKAADEQYTKWDDQVKAFKSDIDDLYEAVDGAMTYAQQKKVEALTAAYKALNADQIEALDWDGYGKDGYYGDLLAIRDASKDAEVVSQANRVSKLVDQLPAAATYSTADKSKIDAARNMYNSVVAETPDAKALLTADLAKIEKAEAEYKNAKRTAYNNARISLSTTQYMYNGKAKTPAVYGLSAFANGTDYTVAYSNNTKTGKATVTVTGRGDCTGLSTKTATFRITRPKLQSAS